MSAHDGEHSSGIDSASVIRAASGLVECSAAAERAVGAAEVEVDVLEARLALATAALASLRAGARAAGVAVASPSRLTRLR